MDKVRFGVVGAGVIGGTHIKALQANPEIAELTALCDIVKEKADKREEEFQTGAKVFTNYKELLDSGRVDAVMIGTPHPVHPEIAIAAAERGIHVLCEKPLSEQIKTARQMVDAAEKGGVQLGVCFQNRTNPVWIKARSIIASGELGEIRRAQWHISSFRTQYYYDSGEWRATWIGEGGGVLVNQSPHQLDLFQWLAGPPRRVRGFCHFGKHHEIAVEDDITAYVEWDNGATGTYVASTGEWPPINRFEIWGDLGRLVHDENGLRHFKCNASVAETNRTIQTTSKGPEYEVAKVEVGDDYPKHAGLVKNMVGAIREGEPLKAPGREALHSLELANAIVLSNAEGRMLELPLDGDAFEAFLEKKREEERKNPPRRKKPGQDRTFEVI